MRGSTRELIKLKDLYFMYLQIYHPSPIQLLNFYLLHEVQWHPQEMCGKIRKLTWLFGILFIKGSADIPISSYPSVVHYGILYNFGKCTIVILKTEKKYAFFLMSWEKRDYQREDKKREWSRHLQQRYSLGRAVLGKNIYESWCHPSIHNCGVTYHKSNDTV